MKNSILDKNTQNVTKINYGTRTLCVELLPHPNQVSSVEHYQNHNHKCNLVSGHKCS